MSKIAAALLVLLLANASLPALANPFASPYDANDGYGTEGDGYGDVAPAQPGWDSDRQPAWDRPAPEPAPTPYTTGGRCLYDGSCRGPNAAFPR